MTGKWLLGLLCCTLGGPALFAQSGFPDLMERESHCASDSCKARISIMLSEQYLESDHIEQAQRWLDYARQNNARSRSEMTSACINSLQSELFYYMGLYQFGQHEAQKGIERFTTLKDSALLSDAYFFKGINQFEMARHADALQSLLRSEKTFPTRRKPHVRTLVSKAYIYNNLAQVKLSTNDPDSARYYNAKAYPIAIAEKLYRGMANIEQTYGQIFLAKQQTDSARAYFVRSRRTAMVHRHYDIALLNIACLMQCEPRKPAIVDELLQQGETLMRQHTINALYREYYYTTVLAVYSQFDDQRQVVGIQQNLIALSAAKDRNANIYIQGITEKYMKSERNLLVSKINALNQQKNIGLLQLLALVLFVLILLFVIVSIRRKNKLQRLLLEQKNEISKDLHDDIGSELSSILINTDLLRKSYPADEAQQLLLKKISHTGAEISERLHTFVWSLNTEHNNVGSFSEYIRQYAVNLFEAGAIAFEYEGHCEAQAQQPLNGYFRKNLFFCIKELINNAVRHSQARNVQMRMRFKGHLLVLSVQDDGRGLPENHPTGNGLKNIAKRIERLQGTIVFETRDGFKATIEVPLPKS